MDRRETGTRKSEEKMTLEQREEEILEAVWTAEEKEDHSLCTIIDSTHAPVHEEIFGAMEKKGLISIEGEKVTLTDDGREKARTVIRRHRLAERLLHDVLNMRIEDAETSACEFEHILAKEVTESICTLLGHPRECPHGTPIPEGRCCLEARRQVKSLVIPLTELEAGETGRVAYISTTHHPRLHKLLSFGVAPGVWVKTHQKYPAIIIQCDNTELALEEEIARDIYVWRGN
jgi:DtxR family Mn-dependent transcriptional regulator